MRTTCAILLVIGFLLLRASEVAFGYEEGVGYLVESPCFSPDGSKIVFASGHAGEYTDIYRINVDGTGLAKLTDGLARYSDPAWSPDGNSIAYVKMET